MSTRTSLAAALKPLLPAKWRIIGNRRNFDSATAPVLMLRQQSFRRTPEAPNSGFTVAFLATVVDPMRDAKRSEDALDEEVEAFLAALATMSGTVTWTEATRVRWDDQRPNAYDIPLTVITTKGATP